MEELDTLLEPSLADSPFKQRDGTCQANRSGRFNIFRRSGLRWLVAIGIFSGAVGCCWIKGHRVPEGITQWQDPSPPKLSLKEKAQAYQERISRQHLMPEGLLRYGIDPREPGDQSYGDLADGPFHTGIYLAGQAFRYATTKEPEALQQMLLALNGLRILMEVTGKPGLLARYFSPVADPHPPKGKNWRQSTALPGYAWRGDVSKDQYAGFIHGLGVSLALVDLPEIRSRVAALAARAADLLMENDLQIIDVDGCRTTHGDLSGRFFVVPIGVNALIALAMAKVAAASTGEKRYLEFYENLVQSHYPAIAFWAHFSVLGVGNRVNDNMAYLAFCPLLLLEKDKAVLSPLRRAERRSWEAVSEDRNAFFSFVHAGLVGDPDYLLEKGETPQMGGILRGRQSLFEFPDDKVEWPVDLTREGFDFPRALFNTRKCEPRTTRGVPLFLRSRSASFWASEPFRLTGNLNCRGDWETAGGDYLLAYWMGRYFGFVSDTE